MTEFGYPRACEEVLAVRRELADQVVRALQDAGLPAFREDAPDGPDVTGPRVMIDADAEPASATVCVSWTPDSGMARAARRRSSPATSRRRPSGVSRRRAPVCRAS